MKRRSVLFIGLALLFLTAGCHFHRHPHGMPPGQAKKMGGPFKVKVGHPGKPWR